MRIKPLKIFSTLIFIGLSGWFIAIFAGPKLLQMYVRAGLGNGKDQPVFSMSIEGKIQAPVPNQSYIDQLKQFQVENVKISVPKEFTVVKQTSTKRYYKKWHKPENKAIIYVVHQPKDFFIRLYPEVKKDAVVNDYQFIRRTMQAKISEVKNLHDAFFLIIKTIFTPDVGEQENLKIMEFASAGKKGFVTYNLSKKGGYFNFNFIGEKADYFGVYIKDIPPTLDLNKALDIISTIESTN
ncbi:MAG: hypothetical protein MUF05_02265 [Candidatus Omnitrophica bacterium]|jgi:hypothetical protein|nr:hypothetical protein [Candidatus Omnitrophota bacterium]